MELRRDIYMPAIEATVIATSAIGGLSNPVTSQDDVTEKYADAAATATSASSSSAENPSWTFFKASTLTFQVFIRPSVNELLSPPTGSALWTTLSLS